MSNNIDKSKLVYVNIVWMKYYRGLSEKDEISPETGGGSHPQEYLDAIETTMNSKSIPKDYNIFVAAENAYLIKEKFRDFKVPRQKDLGYGFGQSNIWYAEEEKAERFKNKTINYINDLKGNNRLKIIQP
ncbi:hypothetical protein C8C76_1229 [Halanaerobium saccharolyticum]|jgi:hypothetical protein|uniref:Uncharacterized protein n=1 Tax=Halanaerobium saccharolyticum TaxID=43595 RepID=A0A2T5RI22_9FIRM|nr:MULTISPECIES: hypothetical protein [Halanaerobium]PTV97835.1 hypothetical protein C8C76_1229 [Halanaerobium saccharolyticum]SDH13492.1 hypothetical protein SAMN04515651_10688 [Halanaerobium congolense]